MSATHERDSQTAPQKERNYIRLRLSWCSTSALLWREDGDTRLIDNSGKKKKDIKIFKARPSSSPKAQLFLPHFNFQIKKKK